VDLWCGCEDEGGVVEELLCEESEWFEQHCFEDGDQCLVPLVGELLEVSDELLDCVDDGVDVDVDVYCGSVVFVVCLCWCGGYEDGEQCRGDCACVSV